MAGSLTQPNLGRRTHDGQGNDKSVQQIAGLMLCKLVLCKRKVITGSAASETVSALKGEPL